MILHPPPFPPLIHKLFGYRKFSETQERWVPLRSFSALWDKKCSTVNLETPPPHLSINFSATGMFLKHSTEGFPYGAFRHCETKHFYGNSWYPPLLSINFFATGNLLKHSTEGFGTVIQKLFDGKYWYSTHPPPLLSKFFSTTENFWITAQNVSRTKFFGTVRQKNFDRKFWHNPFKQKIFRDTKLMKD